MSIFDSIISEAGNKFNLGDKAGTLLSALLAMMTDSSRGGFEGFIDKFKAAGLGDTVLSWIGAGSNTPVSNEQLESALGKDALRNIAEKTGTDFDTATSATAYMTPRVIDALTPNGVVPQENDLLSRIGGYLTGIGGAALGGIGAAASRLGGMPDRTDAAAVRDVDAIDARYDDNNDDSALKWILPLLLVGLLVVLGYWFCGGKSVPVAINPSVNTNTSVNANASINTNANINANTNKAIVVNDNVTANTERKLTEVSLPDGTKLQAYPGGIEDQLIRFIQSDEYKNGTNDTLKDKWFNFDDLNFVFGKTELVPESKRQLDNIVAILKAFPDVKIKIGGYTDKKGDDAANKKLSDDRAKAVKAALEKSSVGAQVPEAEGYGEEFATVPETATDKERESDRKTSVRLIK